MNLHNRADLGGFLNESLVLSTTYPAGNVQGLYSSPLPSNQESASTNGSVNNSVNNLGGIRILVRCRRAAFEIIHCLGQQ